MAALEAVLVGCGMRGRSVFGDYARRRPERLRILAVAEPDPERRAATASEHGLSEARAFGDWPELFALPQVAPVAIIATGDTLHVEPTLAALERGYDVLLEKPIAPDPADCIRVVEAAEQSGRMLQICHVLRFTPFYNRVHEILESGALGDLVAIDLKEHVAHWHMTHSFVRGKFRNRELAAPILLAKCCHDLDLLTWFAGGGAERVASFGSLQHYRSEHAPEGAPERCTDGCPAQTTCIHDAVRFYAGPEEGIARSWPWVDVSPDPSHGARLRALETGHYGRCVYRCDNDVPDHQVVAIEFSSGLTATFTLHGHATHETRTVRATGTLGELRGILHEGRIEVTRHGSLDVERHEFTTDPIGHFGGDGGLLEHFTEAGSRGAAAEVRASGRVALESHLIGFAAEEARTSGRVVRMSEFRAGLGVRAPQPDSRV
jgi:predicted dehydrogenase